MNKELTELLERIRKSELQYIYSHDINDPIFGIKTDRLVWSEKVLSNEETIQRMIGYFEEVYPNDEKKLIDALKELNQ